MNVPAGSSRGTDVVEISVPAEPASLATIRLFSASVGATFGVPPFDTEDLKLVLSELCAGAADAAGASDVFRVTVTSSPGRLRVECRGVASADGADDDRRRGILEALIPDAEYAPDTVSFALGL